MHQRQFHLFITPKFYQKCYEYGLFGVSEINMNQLANVHKGDIAFFYTTRRIGSRTVGEIYGPFEVLSEMFYNPQFVWLSQSDNSKDDKFPVRVKVRLIPDHVCVNPVPIQALWDLRQEGNIRSIMDSSALTNKAVTSLLEQEGILLLQKLLQRNQLPKLDPSGYQGHSFTENPVEITQFHGSRVKEFRLEAQLESYLLMKRGQLMQLSGFPSKGLDTFRMRVLNQVGTYIAGGAIDIVCMYEKKVIDLWLLLNTSIIELKKGVLSADNVNQLVEYIEWAIRLVPGTHRDMIKGILIGRDFANQHERQERVIQAIKQFRPLYNIECYQYVVNPSGTDLEFQKVI